MIDKQIVIIGGGPAGMAAAVAAYDAGATDIIILERDAHLGGILNQCIHNGFGLHHFKEELTGPEYALRYSKMVQERKIAYELNTMVIEISPDRVVTAISAEKGLQQFKAQAIVLAMGCLERPRGALNIPGYRPAGVFSAGTAQRLINIEGYLPGKRVVILGSGDIGLIMARRMTLEGAKVLAVAEILPHSSGLKRNIVQCLDDYGIPLLLSHTVVDVKGKERVEGITLAQVDERMKPIPGTEKEYECDTLLLSCGLIPENDLSEGAGVELSPLTRGAVVDDHMQTSIPGVFSCGNVLHVHDLVDQVSEEAELAGRNAAAYVLHTQEERGLKIDVKPGSGIRYTVPSAIYPASMDEHIIVRFRVSQVAKDCAIVVKLGNKELRRMKKRIVVPAEMQTVLIKREDLSDAREGDVLTIELDLTKEG